VFAIVMVQCTVVVDVKETCRAVGSVRCVAHMAVDDFASPSQICDSTG